MALAAHDWLVPRDLDVFLGAARALRMTGDPWMPANPPYAYPPVLAALLVPLSYLPATAAHTMWTAMDLLCSAGVVATVARVCGATRRDVPVIAWLATLWLAFMPQLVGTTVGQVHTVIALMCVAPLILPEAVGGALIALATSVKLFPGALLGTLWGRPRAIVGAALMGALVNLPLARLWATWVMVVLPRTAQLLPTSGPHVVSLPAVADRLFHRTAYTTPVLESATLQHATALLLVVAMLGALAPAVRVAGQRDRWALLVCVMLLASPGVGLYHLDLLLVAAAVTFLDLEGGEVRFRPRAGRWLVGAGLLIACIPADYALGREPTPLLMWLHTGWGTLLMAPQLYGIALVAAGGSRAVLAESTVGDVRPLPA